MFFAEPFSINYQVLDTFFLGSGLFIQISFVFVWTCYQKYSLPRIIYITHKDTKNLEGDKNLKE